MTSFHFETFFHTETSTLTYLIACQETGEAALVDSVSEDASRYVERLTALGFRLRFLLETHLHADHVTAAGDLKRRYPGAELCLHESAPLQCPFTPLADEQTLSIGHIPVRVLYTPGHTSESVCYLVDASRLLTGDTLFIDSCGRTDFQNGSARALHESLKRLQGFPPDTLVYPGHDYKNRRVSSLGEQALTNRLLGLEASAFVAEVDGWNLPRPRHIDVALPANLRGGERT